MDPELCSYLAALLVGTPSACMASLHRNSLTDERTTARPSPDLQHRHMMSLSHVIGRGTCSKGHHFSFLFFFQMYEYLKKNVLFI